MIFRRTFRQSNPEDSIKDQKICRLFQAQKEIDAARTPDFSTMMTRAERRSSTDRRRVKGLSALPGPQRAVTMAVGLLLVLAGAFIVQRLATSPGADFDTYGAATDIVSWQPPSDSLFPSNPKVWFLEDNWDWQGPTDDLVKTGTRVSFAQGNS